MIINTTYSAPPFRIRLDRERWNKVMELALLYDLTEDEFMARLIDRVWERPKPSVWYMPEER